MVQVGTHVKLGVKDDVVVEYEGTRGGSLDFHPSSSGCEVYSFLWTLWIRREFGVEMIVAGRSVEQGPRIPPINSDWNPRQMYAAGIV